MKTALLWLVILSGLALLLATCTPDDLDDRIYNQCLVTRIVIPGTDTGQSSTRYYYNANDGVARIGYGGASDMVFIYENGKIIERGTNPADPNYRVYFLSPDTTAYASITYLNGQVLDSTRYTYDADKYLVKSVRFTSAFGKDSVLQTFENGNLTRIVIYNSNGTTPQAQFTYTNLPSKSWVYQGMGPYNNNGFYFPWLGKANKNLIATVRSDFNGNNDPATLNWQMNASGFVKTASFNFLGTTTNYQYEYQCE